MDDRAFALFDTPVGRCAVIWNERAICGLHLPGPTEAEARARIERKHPGAVERSPSPLAADLVERIARLLRGEAPVLDDVPLDLEAVPAFDRRVYEAARAIPPGATCTYGALAARIGAPHAARAVGGALGRNPFAIVVPCHRVVAAGGRVGGFSASGGARMKVRLLHLERGGRENLSLF